MALALPELGLGSWAAIAASAALIGGAWNKVLSLIRSISDTVICRAGIRDEVGRAVMSLVWAKGRRSPFSVRIFGSVRSYVRPKQRVEIVGYETIGGEPMLFWFGKVPVVVKMGGESTGGGGTFHQPDNGGAPISLWFLRGTLDLDAFIEEAVTAYNQLTAVIQSGTETPRRRFNVHRVSRSGGGNKIWETGRLDKLMSPPAAATATLDSSDILKRVQHKEVRLVTWSPEDLIEQSSDSPPFDIYPFAADPLSLLPSIDMWLKHEQWFKTKGIPHRMGVLATGTPGTGKSTFVRSVAIKFDLPVYTFDLASLDNQSFMAEWKEAQANAPAIILLEDLDCVFNGREFCATVSKNRDTLTFDCLLNTISGVGSSDGILLFVTTNNVDSLDLALGVPREMGESSTRPGRLDRVIHFGPMEEEQRRKLAAFILDAWPDQVDVVVAAGGGETAAQFQYRCCQMAEKMFWERKGDGVVCTLPHVRYESDEEKKEKEIRRQAQEAQAKALAEGIAYHADRS